MDQSIYPHNNLMLSDLYTNEKFFDNRYIDSQILRQYLAAFELCLNHGELNFNLSIDSYAGSQWRLSIFHSKSYIRHGQAINYSVAMENKDCCFDL